MSQPQEKTSVSSTFMSRLQKADYLQDLRRSARPSGSRPPPPSRYTHNIRKTTSNTNDITEEDGRPPMQQTNSLPIMPSQQLTHSHSRSSIADAKFFGRPIAKAPTNATQDENPTLKKTPSFTYLESGTRWMEKQEVKSLRQALSDMDVAEEQRLHKAAQDEATELVWKHQNPDAAYKNPEHKDYRSHLRKGSYHRSNTDAVPVITSRSSSGSSIEAMQAARKVLPEPADTRRVSGKSYGELAEIVRKDIAESRRRTSSGSRRLMSGEKKFCMHPDDKIWEDTEESPRPFSTIPELRPTAAVSVPAYVRKNPFTRVRMQQERLERPNSAPLLRLQPAKYESIEIQRNPPSQSRNPEYTSTQVILPQIDTDEREKRSGDIRAATSKYRKDRSSNLPQPTLVSDKSGRPIVSFQQDAKLREIVLEQAPSHAQSSTDSRPSSSATIVKSSWNTIPTMNVPDEVMTTQAIPMIYTPKNELMTRQAPTICLPKDEVMTRQVPTICLPEDDTASRAIPTIAIPAERQPMMPQITIDAPTITLSTPTININGAPARPLPSRRDIPSKSTPHYSPSMRQSNVLCAHCALPIAGRILSAAGERFHPGCFVCHGCDCNLELVAFYPEPEAKRAERVERIRARHTALLDADANDGDETLRFYCHLDYHENFSPRCKSCKTPIEGEIIIACGAEWHAGHFFCAQCGDPFDSATPFVEKEGYAWCVGCHTNRYSSKCRKCRKPVTDVVVKALGTDWHVDCFRCQECNGDFGDGRYFLRGESQDPVCVRCEEIRLKA